MSIRGAGRAGSVVAASIVLVITGLSGSAPSARAGTSRTDQDGPGLCPPRAVAYHFSDALDKVSYDGAEVGGLSDIAYDRRLQSYVSSVDNHLSDPSRLWFYRDLGRPRIWRDPLVLRAPDGTAFTGATADNEGLAVLRDGRFLVSSETEPSIRIFGTDGVQQSQLSIPARFRVAPLGQATANATLEGLTVTPDGRTVVASMEGTLSGDTPTDGEPASYRRFLVYTEHGGHYRLTRQLGYRVDAGFRISEVQAYRNGALLVMEAAYAPATGNAIKLYAVPRVASTPDVSRIANLSTAPAAVVGKRLIADVTACPTLGATAKQPQTNPLLDNDEGMVTRPIGHQLYAVDLISDDNFGATQITRVLELVALLP